MVSVFDVAEDAGVSTATVSRVLAGGAPVAADTRARVLESVQRLGYRPNAVARSLRSGRGRAVALVTGDIEQGIYAGLAKHVQAALEPLGLDLVLFNLGHRADRLTRLLADAASLGLRALLFASPDPVDLAELGPLVASAAKAGVSFLSVSQDLSAAGITSIVHDEAGGAVLAVNHLIARGRAPIAFLGRARTSAVGGARHEGYRRALQAEGRGPDPAFLIDIAQGYRGDAGHAAFSEALARGLRPGAVLAASDELALGAMAAAIDLGIRVPDEVAIIGFGGLDWGRHARPALTTVALDAEALGRAIGKAFAGLAAGAVPPRLTRVPPKLIVRQSS